MISGSTQHSNEQDEASEDEATVDPEDNEEQQEDDYLDKEVVSDGEDSQGA